MTPIAAHPNLPLVAPDAATARGAHAKNDATSAAPDPKMLRAAREFEAIFLRNLLKPLESAGAMAKPGGVTSGSGVYGSMMVGALADSASSGGGIGLAHMVLEAMTRGAAATVKK